MISKDGLNSNYPFQCPYQSRARAICSPGGSRWQGTLKRARIEGHPQKGQCLHLPPRDTEIISQCQTCQAQAQAQARKLFQMSRAYKLFQTPLHSSQAILSSTELATRCSGSCSPVLSYFPLCSKYASPSTILIMLTLHLQIQQHLMIIPLPPRPPQPLHLLLLQPPPRRLLQLLAPNLLPRLLLLARPQPRLEPRLHPHPPRRVKRRALGVPAHLLAVALDLQKRVPQRLDLKRPGCVGGAGDEEGFQRGDGVRGRGEEADFVAAEEPAMCQSPPSL